MLQQPKLRSRSSSFGKYQSNTYFSWAHDTKGNQKGKINTFDEKMKLDKGLQFYFFTKFNYKHKFIFRKK